MNYIVVFIVLVLASYAYIKIAEKFKIIDTPNHRSSHKTATIRGGGILFLFAVWLFFFITNYQYPLFCLGVTLIALVSFIDDLVILSSKVRLPFQFLAVLLVFIELDVFSLEWFILLGLLIVSVLFINIYNFMDGINGITGLYSISVLLSLFAINENEAVLNSDLLIYSLLGLVIFGFYNFRKKARFFAGDIGSISIAMVILFCTLSLILELESPLILLFVGVYGADALLTMLYRLLIKEKLTDPHRHHIYQKLVDTYQYPHLSISIVYALLQLVISGVVYLNYTKELNLQYTLFAGIIGALIVLYFFVFKKVEKRRIKS